MGSGWDILVGNGQVCGILDFEAHSSLIEVCPDLIVLPAFQLGCGYLIAATRANVSLEIEEGIGDEEDMMRVCPEEADRLDCETVRGKHWKDVSWESAAPVNIRTPTFRSVLKSRRGSDVAFARITNRIE
jgi:hypothetical protein